ncbi:hypothetical protein EDD21DRAFT_373679 [Dissophora ornata]|nr:hypothetical protein EDD21DRAFT_373679 [Dissophora ornata]
MLGPGPGPAPTPSLTLPPLRELDKALGPESDHGRVPVHHTAPSGQPRSQSSDPHLHQHFHQQRSQQQQQSSYQSHDTVGRFAPSSGSIPDLYMSSPSAPPSTATSSSLSRADSISTMEYLQNNSHGHGHLHRGSASSGSSTSMSLGPNPANQNSHAESRPSTSAAATTASKTGTGVTAGAKDSNGSKSSAAEQGRNTSKRAAQNRAAQRAFRLRKDLYVRELERKAELLQAAESQLIALAARNRELETMFATLQLQMKQQPSSTSSPLPSPLPQQDGAMGPSGPLGRGEREWDRERDWARERPFESTGPFDHFHSSSMRPALGRHQSAQHLRQAYHASSPPLSNGSIKHLSLNSKMSSSFQRPDSDHEIEQGRPLRHLHRHPSESSLNLGRTGSYPAPTSESKEDDGPRIHNYRGTVDSRAEMSSPSPSNRSPLSGPHDSSMHHYPGSPLSPTHERMPLYTSNQNSRSTGANPSSHTSPNTGHGDPAFPPSSSSSSTYDLSKKRPSDGTVNWPGPDLYRTQDSHPHPYHHSVKKQSSWSSLSEQRRLHAIKKQPSWGSISEYRHQWRTKTESPEMTSADIRFGGSAPALPQIPPQFSQKQQQPPQRPTPPQQQHSFDREYPSSPAPFPYSPTVSHAHPPSQQQPSQHSRQSSDYYGHSRGSQDNPHGLSDMDIVQEGVPTSNGNGSYGRQGGYEGDHYESEREDRYTRAEQQPHVGTV